MTNIYDFIRDMMAGMNGVDAGGDLLYSYDDSYSQKVKQLVNENSKYLYAIQAKCGINPFSEEYYGESTGDITIVNIDHFGIKANAQKNIDELRKQVYDAIDWVYNNKQDAIQFINNYEAENIEEDPFDLDWDISEK